MREVEADAMDNVQMIDEILQKVHFDKSDIVTLLKAEGEAKERLFQKASEIKRNTVGNNLYLRGLIEYSNICKKNCYYCGLRSENQQIKRYQLTENEVIESAKIAYEHDFGSLVIQSGERSDKTFVDNITRLIRQIHKATNNKLRITLSVGEQTKETLKKWYDIGVTRYLLRIEVSNPELYKKYHPADSVHDYEKRLETLYTLQRLGYQTGTGVMIGLPFQTVEDLADDLLFFRDMNIDMFGMGPYLAHEQTPLFKYQQYLQSKEVRLEVSFKMIAVLRILMPHVNIAATTAMEAIDPIYGKSRAIRVGSNVIMPNLTPNQYKKDYFLYDNKPIHEDFTQSLLKTLPSECEVAFGQWGDSMHYSLRRSND